MTIEVFSGRERGMTGDGGNGIPWVNAAGDAIHDPNVRSTVDHVGRELARWVQSARGSMPPSLFNRAAYKAPDNPYAQMATAKSAVQSDDVIGGVIDVTEALTFQGVKWESDDVVTADIFNQIARDLNLDDRVRQWFREDSTYDQAVFGFWWGMKEYTYRGKTDGGRKSKRKMRVACPVAMTFLDPTKVVPLRPGPFGQDRLAWSATKEEFAAATALAGDPYGDPVLREFTVGPVNITDEAEISYLEALGIDHRRLLGLNPASVIRLCNTKADYERFPDVRLKSTFALLDLKQQLMEADRVSLVGAANFILLVRQGSKEEPASQEEIDNLKENFKVVAKLPVVVGDHRLSIDIITPNQEYVLTATKYDTIDHRLLQRTLGALTLPAGRSGSSASGSTLTRGIARKLENRRHMLKRFLEAEVARRIIEHPLNEKNFEAEPNIAFTPRNVQIESDSEVARSILALRTQNEISRESVLEYFGFDQAVEAIRREIEKDEYDDIFKTVVPFSSPGQGGQQDPNQPPEPPQVSGGRGGRPPGGGDSPKSPQGQAGGRTGTGNKATGK